MFLKKVDQHLHLIPPCEDSQDRNSVLNVYACARIWLQVCFSAVTSLSKRTTMCTCLPARVILLCGCLGLSFVLWQIACDLWVNKVMAHSDDNKLCFNVLLTYLFCSYAGIWLMHIRSQPIHAIITCSKIPRGKKLYKVQTSLYLCKSTQLRKDKRDAGWKGSVGIIKNYSEAVLLPNGMPERLSYAVCTLKACSQVHTIAL